ncbi:MAG: hypothetical protein COV29_02615 [Candidatus Yanofskybacteria bacterium CG10_big_fil_rev_8_21_14_0_10_36_16]|uniref:Uncharacterized protein n=1 Tax=Candidatus Yanofskybacteria bacterium CG10_big_fil_rev_8_21_14_0_10_36_16 TaxID=1975096 RepID=A0A2J0Q7T4_9BACT|nr:MAG: hypothetical protein COV29_02615 [Candidatus Yanofskybacteria bacterium CG10_big_fil_rev_8_21_14_0_10_36_16]
MKTSHVWIIVIVVAFFGLVWSLSKDRAPSEEPNAEGEEQTQMEQKMEETKATTVKTSTETNINKPLLESGTAEDTARYSQLVKEYETRRVQFDANCRVNSPNSTFKNNTAVMFDNRSADTKIITVGGVDYNFPAYGYKIINIAGIDLPANVSIDCNGVVVETFLIQK